MPRSRHSRQSRRPLPESQIRNEPSQGRPLPAQDDQNSIPFYNARLFSMYESLIQSYTHFTYHANHMYHVLEQVLHGNRNSINANPYPWLLIPHPQMQQTPTQPPTQQPRQPPTQPPTQTQQPRQPPTQTQQPRQPPTQQPRQPPTQTQQPRQPPTQTQQPRQPPTQPPTQTQQPRQPPTQTHQPTTSLETNIINALFGMINQPEEQRLTPAQLDERVETVMFGNIVNPINNVCSITQDSFESTQQVSRIRHCGHIFNSDSLAHWLRINNTCPTCRHNLLTDHPVSRQTNATATARRVQIPLESEININAFYNELLRNSGNIPGFELNAVDNNSVMFSFDLLNNITTASARGTGSGRTGSGGTGSGPRNIDEVD